MKKAGIDLCPLSLFNRFFVELCSYIAEIIRRVYFEPFTKTVRMKTGYHFLFFQRLFTAIADFHWAIPFDIIILQNIYVYKVYHYISDI